jgi:hypothetical protein
MKSRIWNFMIQSKNRILKNLVFSFVQISERNILSNNHETFGLFLSKFKVKVGRTQVLPLSTDNSICPMKRCSAADYPDYVKNFFKRNTINESH